MSRRAPLEMTHAQAATGGSVDRHMRGSVIVQSTRRALHAQSRGVRNPVRAQFLHGGYQTP